MSLYSDVANLDTERKEDRLKVMGERLADGPWKKYCEGLDGLTRSWTALLLENQRQHLKVTRPEVRVADGRLEETTKLLNIGSFDKFAYPIIRAVYPSLIANDIVSVAYQG